MQWFMTALQKWSDFSGRARRMEYWFFVLTYVVIAIVLGFVDSMLGLVTAAGVGILDTLFGLAMLIPAIAVAVRRLHDTDRSGWWVLIGLVPVIGWLVLLVFYVLDSQPGDNRFGPNPKAA